MKKFEMLQEFWTRDTQAWREQVLLKRGTDKPAWCKVAINIQFIKKTANTAKHSKAKCNNMTYAEIYIFFDLYH